MAFNHRMGGGSTMFVVNTPNQDLALTNFAFCSPADFRALGTRGSGLVFALLGDSVVLSIRAHDGIQDGHIALNALQRRQSRVSTGDPISVGRFSLPENFKLALLTLELDFAKAKANRNEQLDAVLLAQQLRRRFVDQS